MSPATDDAIAWCLSEPRTWAVVGCSPSPYRDSHGIASLLIREGHTVIPVNPDAGEILGRRCYPSLPEVPGPVDVVDVFRRSSHAGAVVDEAVARGAEAVWLQLGVIDEDAADRVAEMFEDAGAEDSFVRGATIAWGRERYTGGSYSAWAPGQYARYWPALRRAHGRIYFAGEHTDLYASYMEGAVRSGRRVASEIEARGT